MVVLLGNFKIILRHPLSIQNKLYTNWHTYGIHTLHLNKKKLEIKFTQRHSYQRICLIFTWTASFKNCYDSSELNNLDLNYCQLLTKAIFVKTDGIYQLKGLSTARLIWLILVNCLQIFTALLPLNVFLFKVLFITDNIIPYLYY